MAENFIISLEVMFPLMLYMLLGLGLRKMHWMDPPFSLTLNQLIFRFFLPILLFCNVYTTDFSQQVKLGGVVYAMVGILVTFFCALLFAAKFVSQPNRKPVIVQAVYRSNAAIYGIPIALSLCGPENIGPTSVVIAATVPLLNVLAVLSFEVFQGQKIQWRKILQGIATNPIIIGIALGLLCNLLPFSLPGLLYTSLFNLSKVTTPLSFLVMGATFQLAGAAANRRVLVPITLVKLILVPFVWLAGAVALGFRGPMLVALMMTFCPPVAVSSFPMATAMGGDGQLACEIVVLTSVASLLTVFLWIFSLKSLAFI